jgi:SpoVK/Ycf46/Vps4 family AAA+-type ATPase
LGQDELLDIILFGIPKSWVKEMDRQDFDQFSATTISQVVDFCERLESAEKFNPDQQKRKSGSTSNSKHAQKKSRFSHAKGKPSKGDGKWCEYHETDTHDKSECSGLKKMKEGGKNNSNKKPFNKNKTWTKKSDDAKKFSKKELNALVKKASKKAVKKATKELNAVAKRKRSDSDEDSTSSLHMLKNKMKDVDEQLKNFNFAEVDKAKV